MIEITCTQDGLRRAGVTHPKGLTAYPEDAFSDEQLMMMAGEKKLIVAVVGDGAEGVGADPSVEGYRFVALLEACENLDPDKTNAKDWTKSGVPQTAALELLSDEEDVSAVERDEVFAYYTKVNSK